MVGSMIKSNRGGARIDPKVKRCLQCGGSFTRGPKAKYCYDCVGHSLDEGMKWRQSIKLYGVDKFMFDAMYFEQDGKCLICEDREAMLVDHCHETGRPRGLLCRGCNTMLGFIESNRMERALQYIADGKY